MLTRVGDFAQHQRMRPLLLDAQTRARDPGEDRRG